MTTNACESFHHKYNSLFYTHHPDIFGNIKKIQIDTKISVQKGHTNNKKTKKNFTQQNFIHQRQPKRPKPI